MKRRTIFLQFQDILEIGSHEIEARMLTSGPAALLYMKLKNNDTNIFIITIMRHDENSKETKNHTQ